MNDNRCIGCDYYDICGDDMVCEFFSPSDIDEEIDRFVEDERISFRDEWFIYINEFNG